MSESAINNDLRELHGFLVARVSALVERLAEAATIDEVRMIQHEITELNHRVTIAGNLLFTQQTANIARAMNKVREAKREIEAATEEVGELTRFLKAMSKFLALVDRVIDTAKLLTPLGA